MIHAAPARASALRPVLLVLFAFDAVALFFAGIVHLVGARIPLGPVVFVEPILTPAGIVESLVGVVFVVALYAALLRRPWIWPITLAAHLFAIAAFLFGLYATRNGTTSFNYDYHRAMLVVFVAGLIVILTRPGRVALDKTPGR